LFVLRNVRSEANWEVSVLCIRSRLRAVNSSSLELKIFSLWGLWLVSEWYQIVAWKDVVHHRGKGTITLGFTTPPLPFKMSLQRDSESK
jgi:hypothetical protein